MTENTEEDAINGPRGKLRILILGPTGQLGRELQRSFSSLGRVTAADRNYVDLARPDQIRALIQRIQPGLILNAAAYTAVDRAESERELAFAINAEAPHVLAEEAAKLDALLVHYSTDYVFDGAKPEPWTEADPPRPLGVYGASKLAGERAIQNVAGKHLIFRTSWVYGPSGQNFLLTMLRLARERSRLSIVDDQVGAPTTSIALAHATHSIVAGILAGRFGAAEDWAGIYHMTCAGSTPWFGFAQAIFARATALPGVNAPELVPISTAEYPTAAQRPRNSVLSNAKLHARFGIQLPTWESALDAFFETLRTQYPQ
ncbi:MAG: dTDP-4-dehydrorhamnose reductase [Terracidiphilus sp.]